MLKERWRQANGFVVHGDGEKDCFFCEYTYCNSGSDVDFVDNVTDCRLCPGRLVDKDFDCSNDEYEWDFKPVEFYKELLRLNKIRKGKK